MIQTSPASRTSSSGSTTTAEARLPQTRIGLRRTPVEPHARSAARTAPGCTMKKNVKPAIALEPVSVFTHMLRTSSMIESPSIEVDRPANSRGKPGGRTPPSSRHLDRRRPTRRTRTAATRPAADGRRGWRPLVGAGAPLDDASFISCSSSAVSQAIVLR